MIIHSERAFANTDAIKGFCFYVRAESHAIIEEIDFLFDNDELVVGYIHKELARPIVQFLNESLTNHFKENSRTFSTTFHFNAALNELKKKIENLSLFDGAMAL